ncbi:hypothetical protein [Xanthomonas euvesicatoria]|uniref:Uncharacterized protein n=1 Tax=Xanthomonas euvesicatoria TaxID=456327 RepID=A0AAW3U4Q9_XANEU|nr:hypothetical protein [Xanthomonas euvesicatoria]MBB4724057.1 hypothetical protein [Xanthomonas euvesicatoria]MBB4870414.1 hypothetical protein [Xanthomonas euvesicatoria]
MLKLSLRTTALIVCFVVSFEAIGSTAGQQFLIQGMGERLPAGKANLSLSPLFRVYVFEKAGLKFVQINALNNDVLAVLSLVPGAASQLPIGASAQSSTVQPNGMMTAQANCPCSAQIVYSDANYNIVVIYGANGEYITSYQVPRSPQGKPQ